MAKTCLTALWPDSPFTPQTIRQYCTTGKRQNYCTAVKWTTLFKEKRCGMNSRTRNARSEATPGLRGVAWTGLDFYWSCWNYCRPEETKLKVPNLSNSTSAKYQYLTLIASWRPILNNRWRAAISLPAQVSRATDLSKPASNLFYISLQTCKKTSLLALVFTWAQNE